jgi:hypothetical protein
VLSWLVHRLAGRTFVGVVRSLTYSQDQTPTSFTPCGQSRCPFESGAPVKYASFMQMYFPVWLTDNPTHAHACGGHRSPHAAAISGRKWMAMPRRVGCCFPSGTPQSSARVRGDRVCVSCALVFLFLSVRVCFLVHLCVFFYLKCSLRCFGEFRGETM